MTVRSVADAAELRGMRVLVTGASGLIGYHLVAALAAAGAPVRTAALDAFADRPAGVEHRAGDLTDPRFAAECVEGCEAVFHLAGLRGSVGIQRKLAATLLTTNLLLNVNVMEAARRAGIRRMLYASTVSIYPPLDVYQEDLAWSANPHPADMFAAWAKRMGELQVEAYREQFGLDGIAVVRPVNTYGPRDNFDPGTALVIPALIGRVLSGEDPLVVWGDGSAVRDFLFVSDVVEGMLLAFVRAPGQGPINLGSGRGYSVREVVEGVLAATGRRPRVEWDASKPAGEARKVADISRARTLLGFAPKVGLAQGIARTVAWYERHRKNAARHFTAAEAVR